MRWRKFNGESINLPIKEAVAEAIKQEIEKGIRLKVCIGTDSQVKGKRYRICHSNCFFKRAQWWLHVHS
ncbi:MAG: hypothetical protein V9E96_00710 [Chitinophagaceae bacterium]